MKINDTSNKNTETTADRSSTSSESIIVNEPFRSSVYAANKRLSDGQLAMLDGAICEGERLLFVIVGDLCLTCKYDTSMLAVTERTVYGFDPSYEGGVRTLPIADIKNAAVKRYYGNAMLTLTLRGEDGDKEQVTDFLRFSYKSASLFDAAAHFLCRVSNNADVEAEMDAVWACFEKQFCTCPKCGRALMRPGAECINCQSKNKMIKKLGRYILPYKWMLLFCMLLSIVTTAVSLIPPYMTQTLVDDVLPEGRLDLLGVCVLVLLITRLIQYGVGALRSYYLKITGDRIVADLRDDVYKKAQSLPMRYFDKTSTGSVITRVSGDTSTLQAFMMRVTQEVIVQLFLLVGIVIIMFTMNWQLTLLSLIPVPFVVAGSRVFGKKIAPFYRRIWRRWSAVTSILADTIPGVRVIKAFTNEQKTADTFSEYNAEWLKTDIKASKITTLFPNIVNFVITCGSLLIWGVGGQLVIKSPGFVSPGLLVSFISYTSMFYGPINFFANFNDSYQHALNSAERVLDIIDAEPEADFACGKHPEMLHGKIEFKGVSFSFDRSKKTLSNIDLTIEPGDIVGIVGTTGAGKSTLINLLMRYYDNYDGEILVDGINIKDIDMQFYRSEIGYVQQEPLMFHDSIYANIAYGSPKAKVEEVIHAAEVANAHEFIARLPDGYDTVLGERGTGLSGGEKQRLSIARAVLKNPSILFFDEATASVDSETESLIQDAIERLISGRTTLMIAHRLSTLRKANKIIVIDKGEILEMGTPEELMEKKGKYYKLIQIQTMSEEINKTKKEERFE